ncbi:MAG: hypothetical protein Q4P65_02430 [Eubacteriales bacterium]|nr:hypothetical protein [Eubacteriales bacterium]
MSKILEYECPACGGTVAFGIKQQKLICEHCNSEFDPAIFGQELEAKAETIANKQPEIERWTGEEGMFVYLCESCGGEIIGDETMGSTKCPYCDNNVVIMSKFSGDLRPQWIIPFKLDKDAAMKAYKKHARSSRYTPAIFSNKKHLSEVNSVYVPYWVASGLGYCDFEITGKNIKKTTAGDYETTITNVYDIHLDGQFNFIEVPIQASSRYDKDLLEALEPFKVNEAVPFSSSYLSGFKADRYDITQKKAEKKLYQRMNNSVWTAFSKQVKGYDVVTPRNIKSNFIEHDISYCLLPVWILNTEWEGKTYRYAMNGQTGKIVGELPSSKLQFMKWSLIYIFLYLLIGLVVGYVISPFFGFYG